MALDNSVVIAAVKRGWPLTKIATAAGVSHQAIQQRLRRVYPEYNTYQVGRTYAKRVPRHYRNCLQCRKEYHPYKLKDNLFFCSQECSSLFSREINDSTTTKAINLRLHGNTWKRIGGLLGFTPQGLQRRIWHYLTINDQLNLETVQSIWGACLVDDRPPKWNWLEKSTGIFCTRFGAAVQDKVYRRTDEQ